MRSSDVVFSSFFVFFISIAVFSASFVPVAVSQEACRSYTFSTTTNGALQTYQTCLDLSVLSCSFHWTYSQSTGVADVAFRCSGISSLNWISWGINPSGQRMAGTQALFAFQNSSSSAMIAYTTPLDSSPSLIPGNLSFGVPSISATLVGNVMTIFARLQLTAGTTTVNQVWQVGPVSSDTPGIHATSGANMQSVGSIDLLSGTATAGSNSRSRRRNVHGVLNAVSWGTLMPLGALIARYLKVFKAADPAWFYLHVTCQVTAYGVGVGGWATGLKLKNDFNSNNDVHGNIGAVLFAMATLQVFALLLRPKNDHKYRLYWNIYHHSIGYAVIILSVINVFKGLDILDPEQKWRTAYILVISIIGGAFAILEAVKWAIVLKRRRTGSSERKFSDSLNGTNGYTNGRAHSNGV
ncbi:hypothetical protein SAY87_011618 [Trapa incisa]|uniref:Cytochrome b561 and DOMON domain-containing protein n=1 Tax=Trapa incisa TaxID=236973 RepID=A0AAN7GJJ2_9MYRT|nr:hypothetical protein SAY87_011618 [Trapa incisa]